MNIARTALAFVLMAMALINFFLLLLVTIDVCLILPDLTESFPRSPSSLVMMYDRNGRLFYSCRLNGEYCTPVSRSSVSPQLVSLILFSEDRRFFVHPGFDPVGIIRAAVMNTAGSSVRQGASTITQQLVRLKTGCTAPTLLRKIEELVLSVILELRTTKFDILEAYLNSAYFGDNIYGVDAASRRYFGTPSSSLSTAESALLTVVLSHPLSLSRGEFSELFDHQENLIARAEAGGVLEHSVPSDLILASRRTFLACISGPVPGEMINDFPYLSGFVLRKLRMYCGASLGKYALTVRTSFDTDIQSAARTALSDYLITAGFGNLRTTDELPLEGAVVVTDPLTGELLALIGGKSYSPENQFNRAISSRRRIGSAFKPFLYAIAFREFGYTPETSLRDESLSVYDPVLASYAPENHYYGYRGDVSIREAIARSINTIPVRIAVDLGKDTLAEMAVPFFLGTGLSTEEARQRFPDTYAISLGACSFSPFELAYAFSVFAADGTIHPPKAVLSIADEMGPLPGNDIQRKPLASRPVIRPEAAHQIRDCLTGVFDYGGTAYELYGHALRFDVAGKSGSITDNSWFVGFSPRYLVCVWVGLDDPRFSLPRGVRYRALPVFMDVMEQIHPYDYIAEFDKNMIQEEVTP